MLRFFSRPIWLVVSVAAVLAYEYTLNIDVPGFVYSFGLHQEIMNGTAESPYRYRVLVPYLAEGVSRILSLLTTEERAFSIAYALYNLLSLELLLIALFLWLREWFDLPRSLIGTLFIAGVMPVTFHDHFFQPWSLLEVGLFALALICIRRRLNWHLYGLVVVASFTRETAIFIAVAHAFSLLPSWTPNGARQLLRNSDLRVTLTLVAISAVVFGVLRLALGSAPHMDLLSRFTVNLDPNNLRHAAVNLTLFLGVGWFLAARGYSRSPELLRRLSWTAVPYVMVMFVHGTWYEARHLMSLYPFIAPLVMFGLTWPASTTPVWSEWMVARPPESSPEEATRSAERAGSSGS